MKRLIATPDGAGAQSTDRPEYRSVLINVVTAATREHERAVAARMAATIKAMKDDRALGMGRMYGPDCYGPSPGWNRYHVRQAVKRLK